MQKGAVYNYHYTEHYRSGKQNIVSHTLVHVAFAFSGPFLFWLCLIAFTSSGPFLFWLCLLAFTFKLADRFFSGSA